MLIKNLKVSCFFSKRNESVIKLVRKLNLQSGSNITEPEKNINSFRCKNGLIHEKSEENLKYIKSFIGQKYKLSDDLILQILTHKSFFNGIFPHNEKLSEFGNNFLRFFFAKHTLSKSFDKNSNSAVINFNLLDDFETRNISDNLTLGMFSKLNKLNTVLFWTPIANELSFERSGELDVSSTMIRALIGAITLIHGKRMSESLIENKFLNGSYNLNETFISTLKTYPIN